MVTARPAFVGVMKFARMSEVLRKINEKAQHTYMGVCEHFEEIFRKNTAIIADSR